MKLLHCILETNNSGVTQRWEKSKVIEECFEDLEIRERHGYKFSYTASELKKRGATVGRRSVSEKHFSMTL